MDTLALFPISGEEHCSLLILILAVYFFDILYNVKKFPFIMNRLILSDISCLFIEMLI